MRFKNNVAHFLGNSWTVTRNDRHTFPHSRINFSAPYLDIPELVQKMVDNALETRDDPVYDCHIQDQLFLYAVRAGNDNIEHWGSLVCHNMISILLDIGILDWGSTNHQLSNSGPTPSVAIHYTAVLGNELLLRIEKEEGRVSGLRLQAFGLNLTKSAFRVIAWNRSSELTRSRKR